MTKKWLLLFKWGIITWGTALGVVLLNHSNKKYIKLMIFAGEVVGPVVWICCAAYLRYG